MNKLTAIALVLTLFAASCYYDNAEELYPVEDCDLSNVTYGASVAPIIDRQCLNCHSAAVSFGNVTLETYADIKQYVDNGKLLSSIKHDGSSSPMPKGGDKLSDCNINIIQTWVEAGAPNN